MFSRSNKKGTLVIHIKPLHFWNKLTLVTHITPLHFWNKLPIGFSKFWTFFNGAWILPQTFMRVTEICLLRSRVTITTGAGRHVTNPSIEI